MLRIPCRGLFFFGALICLGFSLSTTPILAQKANDTKKDTAKKNTPPAKTTPTQPTKTTPTPPATTTPPATPPPTTTTSPTNTTPPANDPNSGSSAFNPQVVKHRAMLISTEERVNSLKEKIFRSKAQLMLLQEKLLHGVISTAKLKLHHDNQLGGAFYIESASYSIDGRPVFSKSDKAGSLNEKKQWILFQESISPGSHRVSVDLRVRGNGFGLFSYLNGYKFRIRSSYPFRAEEGKIIEIRIVPYQKGWTVPMQQRVALKYEVKIRKLFAKRKQPTPTP